MYLKEYNKVKSSTVTAGYVDVTDMINIHQVMKKLLTNGIKAFNHVYNQI